ncbi:unnamed protein product [Coregonus sp. 'balchen']|nr:unnamed protein product [Coregonus sp. 'balchen']
MSVVSLLVGLLFNGLLIYAAPLAPVNSIHLPSIDSPPHVPSGELSTDVVIQVISNMTQTIREFLLDMPLYPALGNRDY